MISDMSKFSTRCLDFSISEYEKEREYYYYGIVHGPMVRGFTKNSQFLNTQVRNLNIAKLISAYLNMTNAF